MLLVTCLLLGLTLAAEIETKEEKPTIIVPKYSVIGSNVTVQCLSHGEKSPFHCNIYYTPFNKTEQILLYQRIIGGKTFIHSDCTSLKEDTIDIIDIQANFSGIYYCLVEDNNFSEEHSPTKNLTVYTPGTGPVLDVSKVANDSSAAGLATRCAAHGVAPEPELLITGAGGLTPLSNQTVVAIPTNYTWSIEANMTLDVNGSGEVFCDLFFKDKDIKHETYRDTYTYVFPTYLPNVSVRVAPGGELTTSTEMVETSVVPTAPSASTQLNGLAGHPVLLSAWLALLAAAAHALLHC